MVMMAMVMAMNMIAKVVVVMVITVLEALRRVGLRHRQHRSFHRL
jgi:hypothetical protein